MAKKKVFQISNALTEGLEETITAAHNYTGELRIDVIPIKRIEVDPGNPRDLALTVEDLHDGFSESDPNHARKVDELASLQTIAHSIRDQGIINPIVVYKHGERYRLVAGERRTLASVLAGKSEIQAKILDSKPSELKISLLQWIENVERTDLTLWERLRNLEKIVSAYALKKNVSVEYVTITELSNLIGCTKPHAMNYKAVLHSSDLLKQLIRENKIRNLEKAALIASVHAPSAKQNLINACIAGASLKKMKVMAEQENRKVANPKQAARRGRQASAVNLGVTKNMKVARVILDSIFKHSSLDHLPKQVDNIDWNDCKSVNEMFKQLLKRLEELYA